MKSTILFRDGRTEVVDGAPVSDTVEQTVGFVGDDMTCIGDDVPLAQVERVVFEPHADAD